MNGCRHPPKKRKNSSISISPRDKDTKILANAKTRIISKISNHSLNKSFQPKGLLFSIPVWNIKPSPHRAHALVYAAKVNNPALAWLRPLPSPPKKHTRIIVAAHFQTKKPRAHVDLFHSYNYIQL